MSTLTSFLDDRKIELEAHFALANALEMQLAESDPVPVGELTLSVRHLMTIKSGLIVHVYNIVEATMTKVMDDVAQAVRSTQPEEWTHDALREWLRHHASTSIDGNEDTRLDVIHSAAMQLLSHNPIGELRFKKPSGTWSDKVIYRFAKRLNVSFPLNGEIASQIAPNPRYGDKSAIEFLADRRNAIAHGRKSFEDGANDLTIPDIQMIADITLSYMSFSVSAFQRFIDEQQYRLETA